jgi:hypothetical protein
MNKLTISLATLLVGFLAACGGGDSPKSVAEHFLKSMNSMDFEGAKKYGTEDTDKLLDMMSGFAKMVPDSMKANETKFEITGEKIEGDKATVTYKEEGREGEIPLSLVRVDGKWKVSMSKESMSGTDGGGTMDIGATSLDSSSEAQETEPAASDSVSN